MTLPSTGYSPEPDKTDSEYNRLREENERQRAELLELRGIIDRLTEENGAQKAYIEGIERINANLTVHLEADHERLRQYAADDGPEAIAEDTDPYDGKTDEDSVEYNDGADAGERYTDTTHELNVVSRGAW